MVYVNLSHWGSCGAVKERIRALLQLRADYQRPRALCWKRLHFTLVDDELFSGGMDEEECYINTQFNIVLS